MMKKYTMCLLAAPVFMLGAVSAALAATDGTLGATSTMVYGLSSEVARTVRITGLEDMDLGTFTNQTSLSVTDTICVEVSDGADYTVTIDSSVNAGTFELTQAGYSVPYTVYFDDTGSGANDQAITAGTPLTGRANGSTQTLCGGGVNARLRVVTVRSDMASAGAPGTYTDTITITVEPDI